MTYCRYSRPPLRNPAAAVVVRVRGAQPFRCSSLAVMSTNFALRTAAAAVTPRRSVLEEPGSDRVVDDVARGGRAATRFVCCSCASTDRDGEDAAVGRHRHPGFEGAVCLLVQLPAHLSSCASVVVLLVVVVGVMVVVVGMLRRPVRRSRGRAGVLEQRTPKPRAIFPNFNGESSI